MTPHTHRTYVEGCYRCELSRDEAEATMRDYLATQTMRKIINRVLRITDPAFDVDGWTAEDRFDAIESEMRDALAILDSTPWCPGGADYRELPDPRPENAL